MKAVLNIPNYDCERSMGIMLRSIGVTVCGPTYSLAKSLSRICKLPARSWASRREGSLSDCDLFVTLKHYDVAPLIKSHPRLKGRILWFSVNASFPGVTVSPPWKTQPANPSVPLITSNKFYSGSRRNYACWIPLPEQDVYEVARKGQTEDPICLIHSVHKHGSYGWVSGDIRRECGVKLYGSGSPDKAVPQAYVPRKLASALCYVHIKGHDCPGFSLYQAMISGCPVIVFSRFLHLTGTYDLFENGVTCIVVEDELYGNEKSLERKDAIVESVNSAIETLRDREVNQRIGNAARERIKGLLWNPDKDSGSLRSFITENFPQ